MQATATATPYTIVVSDEEGQQQQQQQQEQSKPSAATVPQAVFSAAKEAWEQTSTKVQSAWDAVTHHTVAHAEQAGAAVGPALEQVGRTASDLGQAAGDHTRALSVAVSQSASDLGQAAGQTASTLGQAAGDHTRALSMATQVAALTTLQATKRSLATIGSNPLTRDEASGETVVKGEQTDAIVTKVAMTPVVAVAAVGLVSGMVSFFMITAQLVDLASITLMLFAPYVAYQKWQLASLGGLRGQQNRLRSSVNRLSTENGTLTRSVDHLETQVQSLNQVEKKLSALAAKRGTQVDKLVETVHANGQLLEKIQQTLEASVMNQLISSIVMSDHDRDFCLSVNEVQELTVTLSCLPGVNFDQVAFNAFVNADDGKLTLDEVLKIIHQLKDDTVQGTDKVFTFHPKDVLKQ